MARLADDADDDAVEDAGRARDHVEVPVRDGVVRAGQMAVITVTSYGDTRLLYLRTFAAQRQFRLDQNVGLQDDSAVRGKDGRKIRVRAAAKSGYIS